MLLPSRNLNWMIFSKYGHNSAIQTTFSIIPNGVNPSELANLPSAVPFREKYNLGDARIVLFMGRLHERKGVYQLAQAFLQANIPATKLVLAGPDEGMQAPLE